MSRIVSRAEAWQSVYQAFNDINFTAFDYNTIKQSLLDYVKLYFPENFNDYIESSEFIAILEIFAYVGELLAYRIDLNAHENFLTTAQRKESILRLAKLISYSASRNIPSRGLIKITSISTTETVLDTLGVNLANRVIRWNDQSNTSWKEQFLLVLNRVLSQEFGTVKPNDRVQIDDVLFELYPLDNVPLSNGVSGFSTTVAGTSLPMELVPVSLSTENGIFEKRPENNSLFTILYGSDGLGDTSDTTGFFCLLKQGKLQKIVTDFDGVTPNQTYDILVNNINDTDVWVNNIDTTTNETIDDGSVPGHKSGEWVEVDLAHAQNIVFNTNSNRHKYEINTLNDDNIRFIFGDGEFADIPSGRFDIWFRTSDNSDIVVPQNSVINQPVSISYVDNVGSTQTFSFTVSLINSLQNAAPSEDIEHIRSVAPAVYYTQDRMVNGRDYNTYMLQDPSILKLRSINRTYAGDSKYITWHDPRETYENVKMFGDDLLLYFKEDTTSVTINNVSDLGILITGYIQPLLASTDIFTKLISSGISESNATRRLFTSTELLNLGNELTLIGAGGYVYLSYDISLTPNQWNTLGTGILNLITIQKDVLDPNTWYISHVTDRLISESQTTKFWNTNSTNIIVDYDSLIPGQDTIVVLKANDKHSRDRSLSRNYEYNVIGQELVGINLPDANLPDIHRLNVLPVDTNKDNIPNDMDLYEILNPKITATATGVITLPIYYIVGEGDVTVTGTTPMVNPTHWTEVGTVGTPSNQITITSLNGNTNVTITVKDYVYFNRLSNLDEWVPQPATIDNINLYIQDDIAFPHPNPNQLWKRYNGRNSLNFAWFHKATSYRLIDPAASNIIDTYIITRGYYTQLRQWLNGITTVTPDLPTPLTLRTDYGYMIDNKMISDTMILHPGKIKLLFGSRAIPTLQATFKVIRPSTKALTDNQVKNVVVDTIKTFFDINTWEFGETFYFTELATAIHNALPSEIDSVVLVPKSSSNQFGDMFQVIVREDEILQPDISVIDVEIVTSYNTQNLRQ